MNQPKPITEYSRETIERIVFGAIAAQGLGKGMYYDPDDHNHILYIADTNPNVHPVDDGKKIAICYMKGHFKIWFGVNQLPSEIIYTA